MLSLQIDLQTNISFLLSLSPFFFTSLAFCPALSRHNGCPFVVASLVTSNRHSFAGISAGISAARHRYPFPLLFFHDGKGGVRMPLSKVQLASGHAEREGERESEREREREREGERGRR